MTSRVGVLVLAVLVIAVPAPAQAAPAFVSELLSDTPGTTIDPNVEVTSAIGSRTGDRAVFSTSEPMLPGDTDSSRDVYARNADGSLSILSDGPSATDPELNVALEGASADASRVFFLTQERLLPSADTDGAYDVYARNADGSLSILTDNPMTPGTDASNEVTFGGSSRDGSRVFFTTSEQFLSADSDGSADIYASNANGSFALMTDSTVNPDPDLSADYGGASDDGSRVFFTSDESRSTSDTDNSADVYASDGSATFTLISDHPTTNPDADMSASFQGNSADGSRVFFYTSEQLLSSDTDNVDDTYARGPTGALDHVSDNPLTSPDAALPAYLVGNSADGSRAVIETAEKLLPSDTDNTYDEYARDTGGGLTHLTDNPTGADAATDTESGEVSRDGSRVFFLTDERLLPDDTDSAVDIYVHNADGTTTLLSDNPATAVYSGLDARFYNAPDDGNEIFFGTEEPLVATDTDSTRDLYRVRAAPPASMEAPSPGSPGPGGPAPGGPAAALPGPDVTIPIVDAFTMGRSFRAAGSGGPIAARPSAIGTTVKYRLSEPATASFTVERPTAGRKVGSKCVKPSRKNRKRRKCTRWVRVGKPFTHSGAAGANSFKFTGRPGRKLRPGSYRLAVVAADAAGNKSAPAQRKFKIVRR